MTQAGQGPPSWTRGQKEKGAHASRELWGLIGWRRALSLPNQVLYRHGVLQSSMRVLDLKSRLRSQQSPDNPQSRDPQA